MSLFRLPVKSELYKLKKYPLTLVVFAVAFILLLVFNIWAAENILQSADVFSYPELLYVTENRLSDLMKLSQSEECSEPDRHFYAQQYAFESLLFDYKVPLGSWQAKLLKIGFEGSESRDSVISTEKCLDIIKSGDLSGALEIYLRYYENSRSLSMISNDLELYTLCNKYSIAPDDNSWRFQLTKEYVLKKLTLYDGVVVSSDNEIKEKEEEIYQLEYRIINNVKEPDYLSVYTLSKNVPSKLIACVILSVFFLICLTMERTNMTELRLASSPCSLRQWFLTKFIICFSAGVIMILVSFILLISCGIISFGANGLSGFNLIGKSGRYISVPAVLFVCTDLFIGVLPLLLTLLVTGALYAFFRTPVVTFPVTVVSTFALYYLMYAHFDISLKAIACLIITAISFTIIEVFEARREVAGDDW